MKLQITVAALLLAAGVMANPVQKLASAAAEVGKEQAAPDAETVRDVSGVKLKVPSRGEGFWPEIRVREGNPYLKYISAWAKKLLAKPDIPFGKSTPEKAIYKTKGGTGGNYGTRTEADTMKKLYWLVTSPESPYQYHEELFRRMLRREVAYAQDYVLHAETYGNHLNDFFALGPALYAIRMTRDTYGDILLPSQREAFDECMKKAGEFWMKEYAKSAKAARYPMGKYANRDLGVANILLNIGLYLNDRKMVEIARSLVHAQEKNLYPDGGFSYIGSQNESPGYHDADAEMLARYYVVTGDDKARELLVKSEAYAPLSTEPGNVSEFWTTASWKHMWNTSLNLGGEPVAGLTGSPWLRTLLDQAIAEGRTTREDPLNIPFYRDDVKPLPLPDNYTVFDRNILGPRGRYGRFSFAATLRPIASNEPGHLTLMGAMTLDEPGSRVYPLNAVMMGAAPKALVKEPRMKKPDWAYLTDDMRSVAVTGYDSSAFAAEYRMHTFGSSTKGVSAPWRGFQQYVTVGDRIVGLLEVAPENKNAKAYELTAVIRLGYGAMGPTQPKKIVKLSDREFGFGTLRCRILDTNFPEFSVETVQIRRSDGAELVFSTGKSAELREFPATARYFVLYELYPEWSEKKVEASAETGALRILRVSVDGREHLFACNPGGKTVSKLPAAKGEFRHWNDGSVDRGSRKLGPWEAVLIDSDSRPARAPLDWRKEAAK